MKKIIAVIVLLGGMAAAQTINATKVVVSSSGTLTPVTRATVVQSQPGSASYSYWIVSHSGGAAVMSGPFNVTNAPAALTTSAYNVISWVSPESGYTFDLLRTATQAAPTGACNCAVIVGTAGTYVLDDSSSLQSYSVPTQGSTTTIDGGTLVAQSFSCLGGAVCTPSGSDPTDTHVMLNGQLEILGSDSGPDIVPGNGDYGSFGYRTATGEPAFPSGFIWRSGSSYAWETTEGPVGNELEGLFTASTVSGGSNNGCVIIGQTLNGSDQRSCMSNLEVEGSATVGSDLQGVFAAPHDTLWADKLMTGHFGPWQDVSGPSVTMLTSDSATDASSGRAVTIANLDSSVNTQACVGFTADKAMGSQLGSICSVLLDPLTGKSGMALYDFDGSAYVKSLSGDGDGNESTAGSMTVAGQLQAEGGMTVPSGKRLQSNGIFTVVSTTVGALPTPSNAGAGAVYVVTDATSATVGACAGGGTTTMIAVSNGTAWTCH